MRLVESVGGRASGVWGEVVLSRFCRREEAVAGIRVGREPGFVPWDPSEAERGGGDIFAYR